MGVRLGQVGLPLSQGVLNGGVDVQIGIGRIAKPVVNDGSDSPALTGAGSLPLNHGGDGHQIPDGQIPALNLCLREAEACQLLTQPLVEAGQVRLHLLVKAVVKVPKELPQHPLRIIGSIKIVGIREQEALQTVGTVPLYILQEPKLAQISVLSRIAQLLRCTNLVFLQKLKNLPALIALRNGHRHNLPVGGGTAQSIHQSVIIIHAIQLEGSGTDFLPCAGEVAVEVEQAGIADQTRLGQLLGDLPHGVCVRNGHGNHLFLLGQGQHIVRPKPHHPGQGDADRQYDGA